MKYTQADLIRIASSLGNCQLHRDGNVSCVCPKHGSPGDDGTSFNMKVSDQGNLVLTCRKNCTYEDLRTALEDRGLIEKRNKVVEMRGSRQWELLAEYDYEDFDGSILYKTKKFRKPDGSKTFAQYRAVGNGGFEKGLGTVKRVLFHLPRLRRAIEEGDMIVFVEGEKDVLTAEGLGLAATCNPMGAKKWDGSYTEQLSGAPIVYVIADNDSDGKEHARLVATSLHKAGTRCAIINLPGLPVKGDLTDWIEQGHDLGQLLDEFAKAANYAPGVDDPALPAEEISIDKALEQLGLGRDPDRDEANGQRYKKLHLGKSYYTRQRGWVHYEDGRFVHDDPKQHKARELGRAVVQGIYAEADRFEKSCPGLHHRLTRFAAKCQDTGPLNNMIQMAALQEGMRAEISEFDRHKEYLNCANGVIDLRTMTLLPHDPALKLTKQCPVEFDLHAEAPEWARFMRHFTSGDLKLEQFLQEAIGYTFTGYTKEQKVFITKGGGGNGKSIFLDTLQLIGGDYAQNVRAKMFMAKTHESQLDSASQLDGARFVNVSELNAGDVLDEAFLKDVSGGTDRVNARYLFNEPYHFKPECTLWFRGQYRPQISGTDEGIWRRILLIPLIADLGAIYKERTLEEKLAKELPGILLWIVVGANRWLTNGQKLNIPECVEKATKSYRADMDMIAAFMFEKCVINQYERIGSLELYEAYCRYMRGIQLTPLGLRRFSADIEARKGIEKKRSSTGFFFQGIRLKSGSEQDMSYDEVEHEPEILAV